MMDEYLETTSMSTEAKLGKLEQETMLAVLELGTNAYAPAVARELEESSGKGVSRGALYMTLERLHQMGWVRWFIEGPTPERGGYPRRRFEATAAGVEALKVEWETPLHVRTRLEEILAREEQ
jgi:DNA-binding PadR family transcriptional regulator